MDKDKDKEDYCNFFYFFIHIKYKKIIWPPRTLRGQTRKMSYINLGIKKNEISQQDHIKNFNISQPLA